MSKTADALKDLLKALKSDRDELRMQLHLGAEELKEELQGEWDVAERGWNKLRTEFIKAGETVDEAVDNLGDDLEDLTEQAREQGQKIAGDIRDGYQRLRDRLKR